VPGRRAMTSTDPKPDFKDRDHAPTATPKQTGRAAQAHGISGDKARTDPLGRGSE